MQNITKLLVYWLLCVLTSASVVAEVMHNTIIFVRHAEKELDGSADPNLSSVGYQTALRLAQMLTKQEISTIITTNYRRTIQTALPTAVAHNIESIAIDSVDETVQRLLNLGYQETALVVGHSNTIPEIISKLNGDAFEIADDDFRSMFIVTMLSFSELSTVRLSY